MSANVINDSVWTPDIVVPTDGDEINGTETLLTTKGLSDRTNYLRSLLPGTRGAANVLMPLGGKIEDAGLELWGWNAAFYGLLQSDVSGNGAMAIEIPAPVGVTITQVRACLNGKALNTGHSSLPATLPVVALYEVDPATGAFFSVGFQDDLSANAAAYDTPHYVTLNLSRVVSPAKRYLVGIGGETGANSLPSRLGLYSIDLSWSAA